MYLTPEQISAVTKANLDNVRANWPFVVEALEWVGINHPLVQVGAAATIAIETGNFLPIEEKESKNPASAVYKAQQRYYKSGYYGRGYIQLTWHFNYLGIGKALGIPLDTCPDLALQPDVAAKILAWFFKTSKVSSADGRFVYVACMDGAWKSVRRGINGPNYYLDEATLTRYLRYCKALSEMVMNVNLEGALSHA